MSAPLAKSARSELARVLEDYETARLGRLNETADALRALCVRFGWGGRADGPARAWARERLELPPL